MTSIRFESVPIGAEVELDGKYVGTTPFDVEIEEPTAGFCQTCLSNGKVVCDWDTLKSYLEDQTVKNLWWNLTRDERYSIAEMAANNVLSYRVYDYRGGSANCMGGIGEWKRAVCVQNSIIRCFKFGDTYPVGGDGCYYKNNLGVEMCYKPEKKLHLPCFNASCATSGPGYGHGFSAIQIGEDASDLNSYVFFHCGSFDMTVGGNSIPVYDYPEIKVRVYLMTMVTCTGVDEINEESEHVWWFYN